MMRAWKNVEISIAQEKLRVYFGRYREVNRVRREINNAVIIVPFKPQVNQHGYYLLTRGGNIFTKKKYMA